MNLFSILTIVLVTLISFTSCNPIRDVTVNDPREITFDINNIKDEDFIIERSKSTAPNYHFIPRPRKTVGQIKIQGNSVWMRFDSYLVSDIWVYSYMSKVLSYAIKVIDESGKSNLINYINSQKVIDKVGLIEFIDYSNNLYINVIRFSKFDLNSVFDYRYHKANIVFSERTSNKLVVVTPKQEDCFEEIYDGETLVYKAKEGELVKKIIIVLRLGKKFLMEITLNLAWEPQFYFENKNGKWINISGMKYIDGYSKEFGLPSYDQLINKDLYDNSTIDLLDITGYKLSGETSLILLSVPTIRINMDTLREIKVGGKSLFFNNPNDVIVYLFKGVSSYEMIEIVSHSYINKITRGSCTLKSPLKKLTRNVNLYYIRENDHWIRTNQSTFLKRFKILSKINFNGEINRLTKNDEVKNKGRIRTIEFARRQLDKIQMLPNIETFETDIRDKTIIKDGILNANIPKTTQPKSTEASNSKPESKSTEASNSKPEPKSTEASNSKPEPKSTEASPINIDSDSSDKRNEQASESFSYQTDDKKDKVDDADETLIDEGYKKLNPLESSDKKPEEEPESPEILPLTMDFNRSNSWDEHTSGDKDTSKYKSRLYSIDEYRLSNYKRDPKLRKSKDNLSGKQKSSKRKDESGFSSYSFLLTSLLFIISF